MIAFLIQLLIPVLLIFIRFKKRKYFLIRILGCAIVTFLIAFFIPNESALGFLGKEASYYIFYLLTYLFAFLYVIVCFDLPLTPALFYTIAAFLIQNLAHHTFGLILRIAGISLINQYDKIEYLVILGSIYLVIYAIFLFTFFYRLKPEMLLKLPTTSTFLISGVFLTIMIILGIFIRHIRYDLFSNLSVATIYETYSVVLDVLILSIQFNVFKNERLKENNKELEQKLEFESQYYKLAQENMELINIKCHDLKHQIGALKSIDDSDVRKKSIKELEKEVLIYEDIAKTGNEALDYIFTDKSLLARKKDITFTYIADGNKVDFMSFSDICCLFGNILDNAIEAVSKIEDKEKRVITLKLIEKANMVYIHVSNYHENKLQFKNGLPLTTKKSSGHGFGTKSIKFIVEKYNGNLTIKDQNNLYIMDILFPIQSK